MEEIKIISTKIAVSQLATMAEQGFGDLVKAVVDIEQGIMAIGGSLHADEEALLLEKGCQQQNLWGINLYPEKFGNNDWIEFDSMINIRPSQNNRSRSVEAPDTRDVIQNIVNRLVGQ